jgi:hypothetical protein
MSTQNGNGRWPHYRSTGFGPSGFVAGPQDEEPKRKRKLLTLKNLIWFLVWFAIGWLATR